MLRDAVSPSTGPNEAQQRLLDSALALFSERGYEGTSIREIIERAGVTRPVLYYYFENKEDLFRQLVESGLTEFTDIIEETLASVEGCRNRLSALMRRAFRRAEESTDRIRLVLQAFFGPAQQGMRERADMLGRLRFRRIAEIMADGLASGELSGGDAETLALAFAGIMDMHIMAKVHMPSAALTDELAEGLVDLFMEGACNGADARAPLRTPFGT